MTPTLSITLSPEEKILAILNPNAVFKDPKADGIEKLRQYIERKRKEEADAEAVP